jgi:hypothetical protein
MSRELAGEPFQPDRSVERAERHLQVRVELMEMPAQPLLAAASLVNEIVAVVDQQLQLAQHLLADAPALQLWLLQRGSRGGERVDPIGLAARAAAGGAAARSTAAAPAPTARSDRSVSARRHG